MEIVFKEESYRIVGACFEVYKEMGCGFLEGVYQECLELEFAAQGIPFRPQVELALSYKGRRLKQKYTPDFVLFDKIVLEIKAVSQLADEHRAQLHNYLKATGHRLGLLANFGHYPKLEWERIVRRPGLLSLLSFFRVFRVFRGLLVGAGMTNACSGAELMASPTWGGRCPPSNLLS